MNKKTLQIIVIMVVILLFVNFVLRVMGLIGDILFWFIIGISAILAYKILPKIKI